MECGAAEFEDGPAPFDSGFVELDGDPAELKASAKLDSSSSELGDGVEADSFKVEFSRAKAWYRGEGKAGWAKKRGPAHRRVARHWRPREAIEFCGGGEGQRSERSQHRVKYKLLFSRGAAGGK